MSNAQSSFIGSKDDPYKHHWIIACLSCVVPSDCYKQSRQEELTFSSQTSEMYLLPAPNIASTYGTFCGQVSSDVAMLRAGAGPKANPSDWSGRLAFC